MPRTLSSNPLVSHHKFNKTKDLRDRGTPSYVNWTSKSLILRGLASQGSPSRLRESAGILRSDDCVHRCPHLRCDQARLVPRDSHPSGDAKTSRHRAGAENRARRRHGMVHRANRAGPVPKTGNCWALSAALDSGGGPIGTCRSGSRSKSVRRSTCAIVRYALGIASRFLALATRT